ncbi:MAG: hypothetical protein ACI4EO_02580 [Blautia sp.]
MKTKNNKTKTYLLTGIICSVFICVLYYLLMTIKFYNIVPFYLWGYFMMVGIVIAAVIGGPILGIIVVGIVPVLTSIVSTGLSDGDTMFTFLWYTDYGFICAGVILAIVVGIFSEKFIKSFGKNIVISIIAGIMIVLLRLILEGSPMIGMWGTWQVNLQMGHINADFFSGLFSDFIIVLIHVASITGVCLISYGILKLLPKSFQEKYYGTGMFCKK